jgi:8-oxo-dGTP pyrophosphatase MutT (NUDIX family)
VNSPAIEIIPIDRLEFAFAPLRWEFAHERRAEIDAHFEVARREKPALWNGQVLLLRDWTIESGVLRGTFLTTDFASFLAWKEFGWPEAQVTNCFAMGALHGADGAPLLGVMASHTANAGMIYFPAGTPDPSDIVGDRVDLDASVWREVAEETGLTPRDLIAAPGWTAVRDGPHLALMKTMRAGVDAKTLQQTIRAYLSAESHPELADIRIVRGPDDLDPAMPNFIAAYLRHVWR